MAVYGITRLLASRDLGPAQIVPTLEAFATDLASKRSVLETFVDRLGEVVAPHPHLVEAYEVARPAIVAVFDEVARTFGAEGDGRGRRFKLGAKQRLDLERDAPVVGGRLQACRGLLDTLLAGLDPQPVPLRLVDILDGPFNRPPIFVDSTRLLLVQCHSPIFEAEVQVLRPMVEVLVRARPAEALDFLVYDPRKRALTLSPDDGAMMQTVDRIVLALGPALGVEAAVVAAVGRHLGARLAIDEACGTIELAA